MTDIETMRERARMHVERGPITDAYAADRDRVIAVLNEILATELVCILRYKRHHFTATGISAGPVAQEFLEHATTEQQHADMVARRISQLGGEPNFSPEGLATRSYTEYDASSGLLEMVKEDLVAERIAIACYQEIVRWLANDDPTTRRMIETILAQKERHAEDLLNILQDMNPAAPDQSGLHFAIPAPNGNGVTPFKLHQVPPRTEN
jgi:bacterioferritin